LRWGLRGAWYLITDFIDGESLAKFVGGERHLGPTWFCGQAEAARPGAGTC
jgi:hypothetical protein